MKSSLAASWYSRALLKKAIACASFFFLGIRRAQYLSFGVSVNRSCSQPRNRLRADIVAASYRAQRFAVHVAASDRFLLLVRGESGLAPEFDALGLRVGAAP